MQSTPIRKWFLFPLVMASFCRAGEGSPCTMTPEQLAGVFPVLYGRGYEEIADEAREILAQHPLEDADRKEVLSFLEAQLSEHLPWSAEQIGALDEAERWLYLWAQGDAMYYLISRGVEAMARKELGHGSRKGRNDDLDYGTAKKILYMFCFKRKKVREFIYQVIDGRKVIGDWKDLELASDLYTEEHIHKRLASLKRAQESMTEQVGKGVAERRRPSFYIMNDVLENVDALQPGKLSLLEKRKLCVFMLKDELVAWYRKNHAGADANAEEGSDKVYDALRIQAPRGTDRCLIASILAQIGKTEGEPGFYAQGIEYLNRLNRRFDAGVEWQVIRGKRNVFFRERCGLAEAAIPLAPDPADILVETLPTEDDAEGNAVGEDVYYWPYAMRTEKRRKRRRKSIEELSDQAVARRIIREHLGAYIKGLDDDMVAAGYDAEALVAAEAYWGFVRSGSLPRDEDERRRYLAAYERLVGGDGE